MSKAQNRAPGVEIVLFNSSLVVVMLAVWVEVGPGKSRRSPPAQFRTRWVSDLVGRMVASCCGRRRSGEGSGSKNVGQLLDGLHLVITKGRKRGCRGWVAYCPAEIDGGPDGSVGRG